MNKYYEPTIKAYGEYARLYDLERKSRVYDKGDIYDTCQELAQAQALHEISTQQALEQLDELLSILLSLEGIKYNHTDIKKGQDIIQATKKHYKKRLELDYDGQKIN